LFSFPFLLHHVHHGVFFLLPPRLSGFVLVRQRVPQMPLDFFVTSVPFGVLARGAGVVLVRATTLKKEKETREARNG
jgi:hypothetical protein